MKDLDTMKSAWQAEEPEAALDFAVTQLSEAKTQEARRRTRWSPLGDLVIAGLVLLGVGNFFADNFRRMLESPAASIPAAAVFLMALCFVNLAVRQLVASSTLDYSEAIVATQAKLAALRKLRFRATQWAFLCALPVWVVFPILAGQMAFGVEFVFALNPAWILANVAFGLLMAPVVNWALLKSKFATSLQDALAGRDIVEAEAFLGDLRSFRSA